MKKQIFFAGALSVLLISSVFQAFAAEVTGTLSTGNEATNTGSNLSGTVVNDIYSLPATGVTNATLSGSFSFSGGSFSGATSITSDTLINFTESGVLGSVVIPASTEITSNTATFDARDLRIAVLSTIPVTLDSQFQYTGGLSFGIDGIKLNFSKPLRLSIPVSATSATVEILVKHSNLTGYSTAALSNSPNATCLNGVATPQSNVATVSAGYATIYTCAASAFVAVVSPATTQTSSGAPLPAGNGGGGSGGASVFDTNVTASGTTTADLEVTVPEEVIADVELKFGDISNNWAKGYIVKLAKRGIINNALRYNPDNSLTRAEFLKIAMNAAGYKGTSTQTPFGDVRSTDWFAPYVSLALQMEIITSSNANFRPNDTITRAEVSKIMVGILGVSAPSITKSDFSDVSPYNGLAKFIQKSKELGIFSGQEVGGKMIFRPGDSITRAEIAKVVALTFKL